MQKAMADVQRKMAASGGVALLQIVKVKSAGNEAQAAQMQAAMAQARQKMEAVIKQGGPGAEAAQQALARMGPPATGSALLEVTMESSGFSTAAIPDSVFAIPEGFHKK
jgi:ribosomal protein S11